MATKTLGTFAREARGFSQTLQTAATDGVNDSALHVTTGIRTQLGLVVADGRLSGTKRNAKLSVGYRRAKVGPNPSALISARGPWPLIESDVKAHRIPKTRTRRTRKARKVLVIPGIGVRASAMHPGTKGQHPFRKGVHRTDQDVPKIITKRIAGAMRKTFG